MIGGVFQLVMNTTFIGLILYSSVNRLVEESDQCDLPKR